MVLQLKICGRCKPGFDKWLSQISHGSQSIDQDMKRFIGAVMKSAQAEGDKSEPDIPKSFSEKAKGLRVEFKKFDEALGKFDSEPECNAQCCENMTKPCESMQISEYIELQQSSAPAQAAFEKQLRVFEWILARPAVGESKTPLASKEALTKMPMESTIVTDGVYSLLSSQSALVSAVPSVDEITHEEDLSSSIVGAVPPGSGPTTQAQSDFGAS
ncbi:hypothetical protein QFC21_006961 [Naganishia friedmannii]|uniref:Uncharacterized protein n=1 Tax=Naganishia friedmannii TaxID=89922 RepID=A0ACC2V053_9TREE|nr:hypothetical protein QFC21_006961 [Naganishia friedmannii]